MKRTINTLATIAIASAMLVATTHADMGNEGGMMQNPNGGMQQPGMMQPGTGGQMGQGMGGQNTMPPRMDGGMSNGQGQMPSGDMRPGMPTPMMGSGTVNITEVQTKMRKMIVEQLTKAGIDTSSITTDMLDPTKTNEDTFRKAIKAILDANPSFRPPMMTGSGQNMMPPRMDGGMNNGQGQMQGGQKGPGMNDGQGMRVPNAGNTNRCGEANTRCGGNTQPQMGQGMGNGQGQQMMQQNTNNKPALTDKERQKIVSKFKSVSDDKKAAYYAKTKASIEAQMERVKKVKNKRLYMKLQETLSILEETLGTSDTEDDSSVLDEVTNN